MFNRRVCPVSAFITHTLPCQLTSKELLSSQFGRHMFLGSVVRRISVPFRRSRIKRYWKPGRDSERRKAIRVWSGDIATERSKSEFPAGNVTQLRSPFFIEYSRIASFAPRSSCRNTLSPSGEKLISPQLGRPALAILVRVVSSPPSGEISCTFI